METYAGLIENGLVVNVVVAGKEWAEENGYIFQTPQNCDYGNISIGDSYDQETQKFIQQPHPTPIED